MGSMQSSSSSSSEPQSRTLHYCTAFSSTGLSVSGNLVPDRLTRRAGVLHRAKRLRGWAGSCLRALLGLAPAVTIALSGLGWIWLHTGRHTSLGCRAVACGRLAIRRPRCSQQAASHLRNKSIITRTGRVIFSESESGCRDHNGFVPVQDDGPTGGDLRLCVCQ
jgi:hypothetical protein